MSANIPAVNSETGRTYASTFTRRANEEFASKLSLDDQRDFERATRGRIDSLDSLVVFHDQSNGRIVWDMDAYGFVEGEAPDTVNPSLWRQAKLNGIYGLFKVTERIYQVRGFDISNISFIEGDSGWIVIDPLTSSETARAAMALVESELGAKPIKAIIYTHSHADHFMGVCGVASRQEIAQESIPIIAPIGFMEAAVFENVIAGNAMLRRASYMYGNILDKGPDGQIDCGLGKSVPSGNISLVAPSVLISQTGQELSIDGVRIVFQYTPDSEAPAEMALFFPELEALCMAENCSGVMHNVYTPRGAQVRDSLAWSKYINEALELFGRRVNVLFNSHNWPHFGQDDLVEYLKFQRDTYRFIHDQTMRLANHGFTPLEIAEKLELPESLAKEFSSRGYYGTLSHNSRAVYQKYLGFFDGNPSNLNPLPPSEAGEAYVEYMGGAAALLERAQRDYDLGKYRWVSQVLTHLVFSEPENFGARQLLASTYEQLAYQAESGPWRNFYLSGALELRSEVSIVPTARPGANFEVLSSMSIDMIFDLFGVRLNGPNAQGRNMAINWDFPDTGEKWVLRLENSALSYLSRLDLEAVATVRLDRHVLDLVLSQKLAMIDAMGSKQVIIDGDVGALIDFFSLLDNFEVDFNIALP